MIGRSGPGSTRLLKSAGVVLSAGSVAMLLMAGSAHAAPLDRAPSELTGCRIEHGNHASASSICLGGTGEQRLVTNCTDGEKSDTGSWVGRGDRSSVNCGRGDVTGLRIEQRAAGTAPREQYTPN